MEMATTRSTAAARRDDVLDAALIEFAGYQPVTGDPPRRKRLTPDPRNLDEYLAQVRR